MLLNSYPAEALLKNGDWAAYFQFDRYDRSLLVAGLVVLVAALLPRLIKNRRLLTAPIVYLAIGAAIALLPIFGEKPDLMEEMWWVKRLTEMVVIIALTSAGLKINHPFAKETWRYSKRLLVVGMPIALVLTFILGHYLFGFAIATAALIAAVTAPTDPVLAAEVQTSPPDEEDVSATRVALTSEAGINDGLAFPFTYLAIGIALMGTNDWQWVWSWFIMDFVYKIGMGVLLGWGLGWLLSKAVLAFPAKQRVAQLSTGIMAISLTLIPYGLAELAGSYGFVAVFVTACVFRHYERSFDYQQHLHDFAEELERILVAIIFVLVGIYAATDLVDTLQWSHVLFAVILIFAVRPLSSILGLFNTGLHRREKWTMAFFGIRGVGSLYYLSYAMYHQQFEGAEEAFALVIFLVMLSVVVHGLSAPGVVEKLEEVETAKSA